EGEKIILALTFTIAENAEESIGNTANLYITPDKDHNNPDMEPASPDSTDGETVKPRPGFSKVMTTGDGSNTVGILEKAPAAGEYLYYRIALKMPKDLSAVDKIVISDTLPENTAYDASKPAVLSYGGGSPVKSGVTVSGSGRGIKAVVDLDDAMRGELQGQLLALSTAAKVTSNITAGTVINEAKYWFDPVDPADPPPDTADGETAVETPIIQPLAGFSKSMVNTNGTEIDNLGAKPKVGDMLYYDILLEAPSSAAGYNTLVVTDILPEKTVFSDAVLTYNNGTAVPGAVISGKGRLARAEITFDDAGRAALSSQTIVFRVTARVDDVISVSPLVNTARYWLNPADPGDNGINPTEPENGSGYDGKTEDTSSFNDKPGGNNDSNNAPEEPIKEEPPTEEPVREEPSTEKPTIEEAENINGGGSSQEPYEPGPDLSNSPNIDGNYDEAPNNFVPTEIPDVYVLIDPEGVSLGYYTPVIDEDESLEWVEINNDEVSLGSVKTNPKTGDMTKTFVTPRLLALLSAASAVLLLIYTKKYVKKTKYSD
ncbi:MAG: isopeptide-forming domain-containing fimbrial protein, partial [Clostridiales bacterium]|nr:isopeptide-forming domain-containing fimbrial protein [Clostridiales bacterium]